MVYGSEGEEAFPKPSTKLNRVGLVNSAEGKAPSLCSDP